MSIDLCLSLSLSLVSPGI